MRLRMGHKNRSVSVRRSSAESSVRRFEKRKERPPGTVHVFSIHCPWNILHSSSNFGQPKWLNCQSYELSNPAYKQTRLVFIVITSAKWVHLTVVLYYYLWGHKASSFVLFSFRWILRSCWSEQSLLFTYFPHKAISHKTTFTHSLIPWVCQTPTPIYIVAHSGRNSKTVYSRTQPEMKNLVNVHNWGVNGFRGARLG